MKTELERLYERIEEIKKFNKIVIMNGMNQYMILKRKK